MPNNMDYLNDLNNQKLIIEIIQHHAKFFNDAPQVLIILSVISIFNKLLLLKFESIFYFMHFNY